MDAPGERPHARGDESRTADRKGSPRSASEGRRKRSVEARYAGWGDGVDREFCARAVQLLPLTFPVASHAGAATIPTVVVARRPDALLVCTFSHCGAHVWPDGQSVDEVPNQDTP